MVWENDLVVLLMGCNHGPAVCVLGGVRLMQENGLVLLLTEFGA